MTVSYRSCNECIPEYLRGQPCAVILYCLSMIRKAAKFRKELVKQINDTGHFQVNSPSGKQDEVKISNGSGYPECTCNAWIRWHIRTLQTLLTFTQWKWSDLSNIYLQKEYLCADSAVLRSSLVNDKDCTSFPDYDDSSQLSNMKDATEYSHDLPKSKVSDKKLVFKIIHTCYFCTKSTEKGVCYLKGY